MNTSLNTYHLPFDLRAEFLARLIADANQLETEQLLFFPKNFYQRAGSPDVLQVSDGWSEQLQKELVHLEISREGMFDALPESIFLHPDEAYPDNVYRAKALSKQEAEARKFLLPFEQLFYWMRIDNERREAAIENNLALYWKRLWACGNPLLEGFSDQNRPVLLQILPLLPEIIGNWTLTAHWISIFLGKSVEINETPPPMYPLSDDMQKRLGACLLGENMLLGSTFTDAIPGIEIKIKLTNADVGDFLEDGKHRCFLEESLLPMLLPIETPYSTVLSVNLSKEVFVLGNTPTSRDTASAAHYNSSDVLGFTRLDFDPTSAMAQNHSFEAIELQFESHIDKTKHFNL